MAKLRSTVKSLFMPSVSFLNLGKEKQEAILNSAIKEFSKKGFKGALVENIAKESKVAKGSIFNYFGGKEGLFLFVFEQALEKVKGHLKSVKNMTETVPFLDRIRIIAREGTKFAKRNPDMLKLYLRLHTETGVEIAFQLLKVVRQYSIKFLCELVEEAKDKGEINTDIDTLALAFLLDSVLERLLQAFSVEHIGDPFGIYARMQESEIMMEKVIGILAKGLKGV